MPTSIWILILILAFVGAWYLFAYLHRERGSTAEMKTYANWHEPIFIEQQFFGYWWRDRAEEEYNLVVAKLKEHGNKFLNPAEDVHLFIHRLDVDNPILDFSDWRIQVRKEQSDILQNWFIPLANRAMASGDKAGAARMLRKAGVMVTADFEPEKN